MEYLQDLVLNAGYVGNNMYIELSAKGRLYMLIYNSMAPCIYVGCSVPSTHRPGGMAPNDKFPPPPVC